MRIVSYTKDPAVLSRSTLTIPDVDEIVVVHSLRKKGVRLNPQGSFCRLLLWLTFEFEPLSSRSHISLDSVTN